MRGKQIKKWLCAALLAGALAAAGAFPAFAEQAVSAVWIDFNNVYETGEIMEPEIEVRTPGVELDSLTWNKELDKWKPGSRVTATVYLVTTDGRDFSESYGAKSINLYGAKFGSAKRVEEGKLKITAAYYPVVQLDSPDEAGWSGTSKTTATWKKSKYATGYQIKLYRDGDIIYYIDATGTSKDLSEYMKREGDYSYEIRATGKDNDDAKYMMSSEYISASNRPVEDLGDISGRFRTYAGGKKYQKEDGSYVANQWYKIQGGWYYFNADECAAVGWLPLEGRWYHLGADGMMETGWKQVDNVWYYFNEDGSMATGWVQSAPNQWYYFNEDGSMAVDTVVDGYRLDKTGMQID